MNVKSLFKPKSIEPYEFAELAGYNARLGQGILHTPEYEARMRKEQERFDERMWARIHDAGLNARV